MNPFGALDAITKEELQEELLSIWREHHLTILMITHDIDEALFLADRSGDDDQRSECSNW